MSLAKLHDQAVQLLRDLGHANGFLASTIEADNYKRIWARDAVVCGVASVLLDDIELLKNFKNSLLTLAKHSHKNGMIPSNVDPKTGDVSFGSLVGRVDANTWFVIGACLYYLHTNDKNTWSILKGKVAQTLDYLKALELNDRGWIYTPLSGNWADEYPIHGYTLYDNALYLWGKRLYAKCTNTRNEDSTDLKTRINFWPTTQNENELVYQKGAFDRAATLKNNHFAAFIIPGKYDLRFDAAANGLAMLLWSLNDSEKESIGNTISLFKSQIGSALIPAFWPILDATSEDWYLLEGNYSFDFKNTPGAFHNGGIWPVWMGLFCLGLSQQGMHEQVRRIANAFESEVIESDHWQFQEFLHAKRLKFKGKAQMGYTASGIVFLKAALDQVDLKASLHF